VGETHGTGRQIYAVRFATDEGPTAKGERRRTIEPSPGISLRPSEKRADFGTGIDRTLLVKGDRLLKIVILKS
jgi:hypothetical protein